MRTPLNESRTATADGNGRAIAQLGPLRSFESWEIKRTTVSSTSTTLIPTARVYRGAIAPSRLIDGTYTGTLDTTQTDMTLTSGDSVVAEWTGADVGSSCILIIEGEATR
jgi:hypothetical protein